MSKISSAIRRLKHSASKGEISSSFQLYENYLYGHGVDKNETLANAALSDCARLLDDSKNFISLDSVQLTDFRRFKNLEVEFDQKLTVFIGDNGTGKTSITESITKILSWIPARLEKEGKTSRPINYSDINVNSTHYAEINVELSIARNSFYESNLARSIKGSGESKESDLSGIDSLANLYRITNAKHHLSLPIFAFYSADRSSIKQPQTFGLEKLPKKAGSSRFDAYDGALDLDGGSGVFTDFLEWFIALDNLVKGDTPPEKSKILEEIKLLESIEDSPQISQLIKQKRTEHDAIKTPNTDYFAKEKRTIEKAITSIIPTIKEITVDSSSGRAEIKAKVQGSNVNIAQLSHGQKVTVALVADLSRRLVTLNSHLSNPLESQGIVIIDEIELHLHPKWQQNILLDLRTTFPNIQFIVTTHSPQVLSVVDKTSIRILSESPNEGIMITTPQYQTKGVISSDILEQIMGTFATPQIPIIRELQSLHAIIAEGRFEEKESNDLFRKLEEHFGKDHPEILRCNSQIQLQKLKARARSKSKKAQKE